MRGLSLAPALGLSLGLALLSAPAQAHDPDMATFELREFEAGWMLSLQVATTAVDRALRTQGELGAAAEDRRAYEEALVSYLEQHVELSSPAGAVRLGPGALRLGPHQSDLVFELRGVAAGAHELHAHIDAFAGPEQVNALRVRPRAGQHLRYMLRASNNDSASWPAQVGVVIEGGEPGPAPSPAAAHEHAHGEAHEHTSTHAHADTQGHGHGHEPRGEAASPAPGRALPWLLGLGFGLGFAFGLRRVLGKRRD